MLSDPRAAAPASALAAAESVCSDAYRCPLCVRVSSVLFLLSTPPLLLLPVAPSPPPALAPLRSPCPTPPLAVLPSPTHAAPAPSSPCLLHSDPPPEHTRPNSAQRHPFLHSATYHRSKPPPPYSLRSAFRPPTATHLRSASTAPPVRRTPIQTATYAVAGISDPAARRLRTTPDPATPPAARPSSPSLAVLPPPLRAPARRSSPRA